MATERPGDNPIDPRLVGLQQAALQMLGAVKGLVEAAEAVVADPSLLDGVGRTVADTIKAAVASFVPPANGTAARSGSAASPGSTFEHIDIAGGDDLEGDL